MISRQKCASEEVSPHPAPAWSALFVAAFLASAAAALPAQPLPLAPEVPLDPSPAAGADCPYLAARDDGSFVALWRRLEEREPGVQRDEVLLARADAAGRIVASARVDEGAPKLRYAEGLAATPSGYEALWLEQGGDFRREHRSLSLDEEGKPLDLPHGVGHRTVLLSPRPVGGFVAYWASGRRSRVQLVDAEGTALTSPVTLAGVFARVVHGPDGRFVVLSQLFERRRRTVRGLGVQAQRFDLRGVPAGSPFEVVPARDDGFSNALWVAALGADGTLAVAAAADIGLGGGGYGDVALRTFAADGQPLGRFEVTSRRQAERLWSHPAALAVGPDGRVLLVWTQFPYNDTPRVRARIFDRAASPLGDSFVPPSAASAEYPAVLCATAIRASGTWVVGWVGAHDVFGANPRRRVFVRRFADP